MRKTKVPSFLLICCQSTHLVKNVLRSILAPDWSTSSSQLTSKPPPPPPRLPMRAQSPFTKSAFIGGLEDNPISNNKLTNRVLRINDLNILKNSNLNIFVFIVQISISIYKQKFDKQEMFFFLIFFLLNFLNENYIGKIQSVFILFKQQMLFQRLKRFLVGNIKIKYPNGDLIRFFPHSSLIAV